MPHPNLPGYARHATTPTSTHSNTTGTGLRRSDCARQTHPAPDRIPAPVPRRSAKIRRDPAPDRRLQRLRSAIERRPLAAADPTVQEHCLCNSRRSLLTRANSVSLREGLASAWTNLRLDPSPRWIGAEWEVMGMRKDGQYFPLRASKFSQVGCRYLDIPRVFVWRAVGRRVR
jgi:hypothetical protein